MLTCTLLCKSVGGRQKTAEVPQLLSDGVWEQILPQIVEEILMEFSQFLDRWQPRRDELRGGVMQGLGRTTAYGHRR